MYAMLALSSNLPTQADEVDVVEEERGQGPKQKTRSVFTIQKSNNRADLSAILEKSDSRRQPMKQLIAQTVVPVKTSCGR